MAENVVAGYLPGIDILNGVNLTLADGELVGIIGPNGAGKSTLLKAMFGLVSIGRGRSDSAAMTSRRCRLTSRCPRGRLRTPARERLPSLTVEENLQMGLYLRPAAWAERHAYVTTSVPAAR